MGGPGFHERLPLLRDTPVVRRVEAEAVRWDRERRLKVALANDNGAPWWLVVAKRSVADLERRFQEGSMATVLLRNVGGILGDHHGTGKVGKGCHYLYMQLKSVNDDVSMCLKESGVLQIVRQVPRSEISNP